MSLVFLVNPFHGKSLVLSRPLLSRPRPREVFFPNFPYSRVFRGYPLRGFLENIAHNQRKGEVLPALQHNFTAYCALCSNIQSNNSWLV